MFPSFRSFVIFLGCLGVIVFLGSAFILNIGDMFYAIYCVENRAVEVSSPDGSSVARSVRSNCGPLGGVSTRVYLRTAGWGIPRLKLHLVFEYEGDLDYLRLRETPLALVIEHNACAAIVWTQRATWRDVSITYHQRQGLPPEYHCRGPGYAE